MATITIIQPDPTYLADKEASRWYDGLGLYLALALFAGILAVLAL
jgi:hypothetical protein